MRTKARQEGAERWLLHPLEAFCRYCTIDSSLFETATRVAGIDKYAAPEAMDAALALVGLAYTDMHGKYPNQISGGELQLTSLAWALMPHLNPIDADDLVSMIKHRAT